MVNLQTYVGTASPYNFNGLVRHYYLRRGPNVADIQVTCCPKATANCRATTSPSGCARASSPIAARYGARIKVAEVPPGPPVLETLVAEVYGPRRTRGSTWRAGSAICGRRTDGVVDVDWYVEDDQPEYRLVVDQEKAALNGVSEDDIARTVRLAPPATRPACCTSIPPRKTSR